MAISRTPAPWTEAEFEAARELAPRSERWEFIDGEVLVTPGPNIGHQTVVGRLWRRIDDYVRANRVGIVVMVPFDMRLRDGVIVQPDLTVLPRGSVTMTSPSGASALLVVEVLSRGSLRHDRIRKRPIYQEASATYWIVDWPKRHVEVWQPTDTEPTIVSDVLVWSPVGAATPLRIDLPTVFDDADPERG